jgi:atypical dual specificity phosphatase
MDYKRAVLNFSFIMPNTLAGMAKPGLTNPLIEDLAFLDLQGIKAIISLSEAPLEEELVRRSGFSYMHVPVNDFTAPTIGQVEKCIGFIEQMANLDNRPVAVHCGAGCGRTGTILACYWVNKGKTADNAIEIVRSARPCSIETESQKALVYQYEDHLRYQSLSD